MKFTTSFWLTCLGSLVILDQIKRACSHHWVGNSLLDLDDGAYNVTSNLTGWSSPYIDLGRAMCTLYFPLFWGRPAVAYSQYIMEKTYTNLPPHNTLMISVQVYLVNNMTVDQSFGMTIDSDPIVYREAGHELGPYPIVYLNGWNTSQFPSTPRYCNTQTGQFNITKQLKVQLVQTYNHSASEFTLYLSAMNGSLTSYSKVYFREVNITFLNTTNSSYSQCVRSLITAPGSVFSRFTSPSSIGGCPCPLANQYQSPPNSGNCSSCHATCATCDGPLASNCLTCDTGKVLNGSNCQDPSPGRLLLNPSISSQDQAEEMWCLWIVLGIAIIGIMFWSLGSYKAKRDSLRKKVTHDRLDSVEIAELQTTD